MRYKLGCVAVCAIVVWKLGHSVSQHGTRPPFTPNFYCDHGYLRENADVCQDRLNRPAPIDECVNCFEYRNSIIDQKRILVHQGAVICSGCGRTENISIAA